VTFLEKLLTVAALAVVVALIALSRSPAPNDRASRGSITLWLTIVAAALIVVGIVSNTLIRHIIQIAPLALALLLSMRRSAAGIAAAAPLFAFWFLVMVSIWLFLLGLARIFTGRFPPIEIALTIVIGVASILGLAATYRQGTAMPFSRRAGTVVVFAVLQYAAMWLSAQPFATTR